MQKHLDAAHTLLHETSIEAIHLAVQNCTLTSEEKPLKLGFEVELDYYNSTADSEFDLFEVEIEPTLIWSRKLSKGKFSAELEAPVLRLYSNDSGEDDFEYEGLEAIFKYQRILSKRTRLQFELKLPYDAIDNEIEYKPNFSLTHRF